MSTWELPVDYGCAEVDARKAEAAHSLPHVGTASALNIPCHVNLKFCMTPPNLVMIMWIELASLTQSKHFLLYPNV